MVSDLRNDVHQIHNPQLALILSCLANIALQKHMQYNTSISALNGSFSIYFL